MVEVVLSVAAKFSEFLVAPIGRQFGYLCYYRSNTENLKKQVEKLTDARERVKHSVDDAKRKGELIEQDVEKWLMSVNVIIDEAWKITDDEDKANTRCFKGLCPNLKTRYQLSRKAVQKTEAIVRHHEDGKFDTVSYSTLPEETWLTSIKCYEAFESRTSTLKDILNTLSSPNVNLLGVYGMGGVGKTTLVKEVARQAKKDNLFDKVVFVDVSQNPDIRKIQGEIADELGFQFHEESVSGRARSLCTRLKNEKKILVILDDIWASLDFEVVGIPFGYDHEGCKVLLTSRNRDVLSREMDSQNNFLIGALNEKEAWSLFKKMTGDYVENCHLRSVATEVARECAGLPIAIVTIAKALRGEDLSEWKDALQELRRPSLRNFTGLQAVACSTIELSYNHLKGDELKSTFLLIGCTFITNINDLLKYSMGMGLFKGVNTMEEARHRVYTLVRKLKASCLLFDGHTSEWFFMHDVVRDVAISIASRDGYVFRVKGDVVQREWEDKDTLKGCMVIALDDNNVDELPDRLECPQLKFCYIHSKDRFLKIPDNIFTGMTELRVLDLTRMHLLLMPSSLNLLRNLQTLCLDGCILGDIAIVGGLKKLEILSLLNSDIEQLPEEIGQLTHLRLLDLSNCFKLKVIPPNVISSLCRLEELYMGNTSVQWEVVGLDTERSNASLDELNHLSRLTALEIHIRDEKVLPKGLFSKKLERYKILIGENWWWSAKCETSRTLKLNFTNNICFEYKVTTELWGIEGLHLGELHGVKNVLYELDREGFPQLKYLYVQDNTSLLCIIGSMKLVPCDVLSLLESLFLRNLINLEKICHGQLATESFHQLRIIKVQECDKLKNIFSFSLAKCLQQLQEIEVLQCKNMEVVFSICTEGKVSNNEASDEIEFAQLRSLTLSSLPNLTSFCSDVKMPNFTCSNEIILDNDNAVPFFKEKIVFPNLKTLKLSSINFKYMFSYCMVRKLVQLEYLEISHCMVLEEIIVMEDVESLSESYIEFPSLKTLVIIGCPRLKAFVSKSIGTVMTTDIQPFFDEKVAFPSLEEMTIFFMDNLKIMWQNKLSKDSFGKLKSLRIRSCHKLRIIFPSNMLGRFRQLELLVVNCCFSLEQIFELKRVNFEEIIEWNQDPQGIVLFQNLHKVTVDKCPCLKYLFPSSIAKSLLELQELEMYYCPRVQEIVAKEGGPGAAAAFVFPRATSLQLRKLPNLRNFYRGIHTSGWPLLKKLEVHDCDKINVFSSEFRNFHETDESQFDIPAQQHLVTNETVMLSLEELILCKKDVITIPEHICYKLKALCIVNDESTGFPPGFLQRFHNLKKLVLISTSYKEIFSCGEMVKLSETKLEPCTVSDPKHTWKQQDSKLDYFLHNISILEVTHCNSLINLLPSSVSLGNLTTLRACNCNGLINLLTSSTAKSLARLRSIFISHCNMLAEIVTDEGDDVTRADEIIFSKLESLTLRNLSSLTSFCSGNYRFKFPSLDDIDVQRCPNMKFFSQGVLSTPRLQHLREGLLNQCWEGDLNTTIQQLHKKASSEEDTCQPSTSMQRIRPFLFS